MGQLQKLLSAVLAGRSDQNIAFARLVVLLQALGFELRVKGSHHIFTKTGVEDIINLQPNGGLAKPYQVKQVRQLLLKYKLELPDAL